MSATFPCLKRVEKTAVGMLVAAGISTGCATPPLSEISLQPTFKTNAGQNDRMFNDRLLSKELFSKVDQEIVDAAREGADFLGNVKKTDLAEILFTGGKGTRILICPPTDDQDGFICGGLVGKESFEELYTMPAHAKLLSTLLKICKLQDRMLLEGVEVPQIDVAKLSATYEQDYEHFHGDMHDKTPAEFQKAFQSLLFGLADTNLAYNPPDPLSLKQQQQTRRKFVESLQQAKDYRYEFIFANREGRSHSGDPYGRNNTEVDFETLTDKEPKAKLFLPWLSHEDLEIVVGENPDFNQEQLKIIQKLKQAADNDFWSASQNDFTYISTWKQKGLFAPEHDFVFSVSMLNPHSKLADVMRRYFTGGKNLGSQTLPVLTATPPFPPPSP